MSQIQLRSPTSTAASANIHPHEYCSTPHLCQTQYPNRHAKLDKPDQSDNSAQFNGSTTVPGTMFRLFEKMLEMLDAEISYWQFSDVIPSLKDLKHLEYI